MIGKIIEQMPIISLLIMLKALFLIDLYVLIVTKKGTNYPHHGGCLYKYLGWIKSGRAYFLLMCLYTAFGQFLFITTLSYVGEFSGFKLVLPSKMCWFFIIVFSSAIVLIRYFKILMKGISKHIIIDDGIPKPEPTNNETEKISSLLALAIIIHGLFLGQMEDEKRKPILISMRMGIVLLFLCSFPTLVNILAIATNRNFP